MSDKYSVDDILNEVKAMKSGEIFIEKQFKNAPLQKKERKFDDEVLKVKQASDKSVSVPEAVAESESERIPEQKKASDAVSEKEKRVDYSNMTPDDFFKMIESNSESHIVGGFKVKLNNRPEPNIPTVPFVKPEEKSPAIKKESAPEPVVEETAEKPAEATTAKHQISVTDELFKKKDEDIGKTIAFDKNDVLEAISREREENSDNKDNGVKVTKFRENHKPEHVLSADEIAGNKIGETVRFKLDDSVIDLSKKKEDPVEEVSEIPEALQDAEPLFSDLDFGFKEPENESDVSVIGESVPLTSGITYTDDEARPEEKHEAFAKKTRRKIENERFDYSNENVSDDDVIDDYCSIDDAESVKYDLDASARQVTRRLFATLIALTLSGVLTTNVIGIVSLTENVNNFLIANAAVLAVTIIINIKSFFRGLFSLCTFKPDVDSALSVALLAAAVQSGAAFAFSATVAKESIPMFTLAAVCACVFNLLGKRSMISRIRNNFKLVATTTVKQSCFIADDRMGEMLEQDDFIGTPTVAGSKSVINLHNYLYNSYCSDPSDNICKTLAPIGLIAALASLAITYFMTNNVMTALSYFAAVAIVCVPATALLSANMPLKSAAKKMRARGGLLTGYDAVEQFSDVDCAVVNSEELFPAGAVELLSLRAIGEVSIEDVILKSAALTINAGGPLADVFDKIIEGRRKMLPPVSDMFYEDYMGLTGTIEGKTVRVGNRAFMDAYGIYGLSDEAIDEKAKRNGSFVVYTAIEDEVCGMFAVKYKSVEPDVDECVYNLVRNGITIAVKTNDPNITPELIGQVFDIPPEYIVVMGSHIVEHFDESSSPSQNGDSVIAHNNNISVFASLLIACKKLRTKTLLAVILQTVLTIVGFGATMLFAVSDGGFNMINPGNIVAFQCVCAVITLLIPSVIKQIK